MRVLVVNTGSSSLKLALLDGTQLLASRTVERWAGEDDLSELTAFVEEVGEPEAVGHRFVHGGPARSGPVLLDRSVLVHLESLSPLAPLHQPRSVAAVRAIEKLLPEPPAVACFDTTFHSTLPASAATYALPRAWNSRWHIQRYGYHGLSHAYAVRRAAELLEETVTSLRMVTCHLGAGSSLCAVLDGRSVDTTMGFTPLDGLVMATRSGSVDPGVLLWLQQVAGVPVDELADALQRRAGLAGLSGTSGDLRDVDAARAAGDTDAQLAYEVFVHRLAGQVATMTTATGGLDVLVLTGGIGEHAPDVRARLAQRLAYLGVELDESSNHAAREDADITAAAARVRTVVVTAREDLQIAAEATRLLST